MGRFSGNLAQAPDFSAAQEAALTLELYAARHQDEAKAYTVKDIESAAIPFTRCTTDSYCETTVFFPTDADMTVMHLIDRSFSTRKHALTLPALGSYIYSITSVNVDDQCIPEASKKFVGICEIAADDTALKGLIAMSLDLKSGTVSKGELEFRIPKLARLQLYRDALNYRER